jgi:hypothetical protein
MMNARCDERARLAHDESLRTACPLVKAQARPRRRCCGRALAADARMVVVLVVIFVGAPQRVLDLDIRRGHDERTRGPAKEEGRGGG